MALRPFASSFNNIVEEAKKRVKKEIWECKRCGESAPCRIEINYELCEYGKEPHERFTGAPCVCKERHDYEWLPVTVTATEQPKVWTAGMRALSHWAMYADADGRDLKTDESPEGHLYLAALKALEGK